MRKLTTLLIALTPLLFADTTTDNKEPTDTNQENAEIATIDPPVIAGHSLEAPSIEAPKEQVEPPTKNPYIAVGVSALLPGSGNLYLGDYKSAAGLGSASIISYNTYENSEGQNKLISGMVFQNTWSYGLYSAYRDVRNYNQQKGYRFEMPQDSFEDLVTAPFRFSVMKKKEVWGGILGFLTAGAVISHYAFPDASIHIPLSATDPRTIPPLMALPVGIGEEALFRGFIQSCLMEYSSPVPAIIGSSLIFGYAHVPNADALPEKQRQAYYTAAVPLITAFGGYMGWLTHKTGSLKYSTAIHTWYDFIIFSAAASAKKDSTTKAVLGKPSCSFSFSY